MQVDHTKSPVKEGKPVTDYRKSNLIASKDASTWDRYGQTKPSLDQENVNLRKNIPEQYHMDKMSYNDLKQFKTLQSHLGFLTENVNAWIGKFGYKDEKLMKFVSNIRHQETDANYNIEYFAQERQLADLEEQIETEEQFLRAPGSKSPKRDSSNNDIANLEKEINYLENKLDEQKQEIFSLDVKIFYSKFNEIDGIRTH